MEATNRDNVTDSPYIDSPYIFNPKASAPNISDGISERIGQARALVMAMSGDGADGENDFYTLSAELKSNYVWALDRKICEIEHLFTAYQAKCKGGAHG